MSPTVLPFRDLEKASVTETDTSTAALGAVMSQEKSGGKVLSIQYASWSVITAVSRYLARERGARAGVTRLQKCQLYLFSI